MTDADFTTLVERVVREHALAVEKLTEKQLVDLIKQMIASGDITKYVMPDGTQTMVYIPFAEAERLKTQIEELKAELVAGPHDGPPFTGPEVLQRKITYDDVVRAYQEGRNWHGGML